MKLPTLILPYVLSCLVYCGCNNNTSTSDSAATDTTSTNPTENAEDYHPDQRQHIPATDSSNVVGTDTINASEATPNTGTVKSANDQKAAKDTTK
ncbi:MAG TPA: hypothetical protein VEV83_14795 [Parafilimonas sp.]|nr:hypothetical protein [Parafilimonas sp.]